MNPSASDAGPAADHGGARRYATIRYRLILIEWFVGVLFLWGYQATGGSAAVAHAVHAAGAGFGLLQYLLVFGTIQYVLFFPLHVYGGWLLERRFGLSRLTWAGWAVRELKRMVLSAAFGLLLVEGLYAILQVWPGWWTILATLGWVGVSVVLARVFPTWLVPIFYKTTPLTDATLRSRVLALCEHAGLQVLGAFRVELGVETRKANAALAGLGATRRVLLSDTLLSHFTLEEIETVLAHELGHQRHRHLTKLLLLSAVGSWIALSLVDAVSPWWLARWHLDGLSDPAGFPLLMLALSVVGALGLPIQQAISRHFEWQADRFAVALTRQPSVFAVALRKLGELNLADPAPPRWVEWLFYDHPPIMRRIHAAEAAAASS